MKLNLKRSGLVLVVLLLAVSLSTCFIPAKATTGIIGQWHFDEGVGSWAYDSSGNGLTCYLGTYPSWTYLSKGGMSLALDGSGNSNGSVNGSSLNFSANMGFTIEAWVYVPENLNKWQGIITKGRSNSSTSWYGLWISGDNRWVMGGYNNNIFSSNYVTRGWHHLAEVQIGPYMARYLFVDGVQVAYGPSSDGQSGTMGLCIGTTNTGENFTGCIDEVTIRNYPLDTTTIINDASNRPAASMIMGTYHDASGQVETRIFRSQVYGEFNTATVNVDPGYVLVGGGAFADYGNGAGALLTASYPLDNRLTTWVAQSKDHGIIDYHTLYVYAIGMKLKDSSGNAIPRETVRSHMTWVRNVSSTSEIPWCYATLPNYPYHYILLSGGAQVINPFAVGSLLTYSNPTYDNVWLAESKDCVYPYSTQIAAYAIGWDQGNVPGFGYLGVSVGYGGNSIANTYDYQPGFATASPLSGFLLTGIGAESFYYGNGRFLTCLAPDNSSQAAVARDKDHLIADHDFIMLYMIQISKLY